MSDNNLFKDNEISDSEFENTFDITDEPTSEKADDEILEQVEPILQSDEEMNDSAISEEPKTEEAYNYVPNFVEYSAPVAAADPQNKKGIKVFVLLIAAALVLAAVATLGYFAGKNSFPSNSGGSHTLDLASKPENSDKYTTEQVYEVVNKSVVGIAVYDNEGIKGYASGVIYSEDGYIITNDHIYEGVTAAKFKIYTYDGSVYSAKYVAGDSRSDLALLKVDSSGFYPATFGNSDELKYGEQVVAIGRPNDATSSSSITGGYISFLNRRVSNSTSYASRLIQTDSAINPGSSGGALVNMYGQVVGITSSKLVGSEYEGVGYAIPSTTVKFVVEELIVNGTVTSRAKLGVSYTEIDSVTAEINGSDITGLLIAEVNDDSSLKGKVSVNDVITEINGQKITKGDMVLDIIETAKPGDTVELTVFINNSRTYKTVKAQLIQAESTSSYESELSREPEIPKPENNGGTFDFPYGY